MGRKYRRKLGRNERSSQKSDMQKEERKTEEVKEYRWWNSECRKKGKEIQRKLVEKFKDHRNE